MTSRRYGKKTCAAPSVPAQELEDLVVKSLLAAFSDTTLFATAVENILASAADDKAPLEAERASLLTTVAQKERLLAKYQDDYESGDLSAKLYTTRTTELQTELDTANNRLGVVEAELEATERPAPTDEDRQRILGYLEHGLREGSAPLRKGLLSTVIDNLEVHTLDDIRPTYRVLLEVPENVPGIPEQDSPDGEMATLGEAFSSSRLGWS